MLDGFLIREIRPRCMNGCMNERVGERHNKNSPAKRVFVCFAHQNKNKLFCFHFLLTKENSSEKKLLYSEQSNFFE